MVQTDVAVEATPISIYLLNRCAYDCNQFTPTIMTMLISSSTVPITVAPTKSYCSKHWKINTGAIKSLKGKLLDTITMLPNSPSALLNARAVPVRRGGSRGGSVTFVKVYQGDAPRDQAASSTSFSISCKSQQYTDLWYTSHRTAISGVVKGNAG